MKKIVSVFCSMLMVILLFGNVAYARNNTKVIGPIPCPNVPFDKKNCCGCINTGEKFDFPHACPPMNNSCNGICNNTWVNNNGYCCEKNVRPIEKGWHSDNIGKYYYKGDGTVFKNGWYWIDGKYYKFDYNGYVYRNQWIKDNWGGSWYFVDCDGACVTGWRNIDNVWYYFNPEIGSLYGVMARDTMMYINDGVFGRGYFAFNKDGAIITNSWYGGHYYGNNGVRVD